MSDDQPPLVPPGSTPDAAGSAPPAGSWGSAPPPPAAPVYGPGAAYPGGRPLHKPGTIPLRPLTLTDFFDGAFSTVRRNPRATIGMAALVTAGFMLLPILGALVLGLAGTLDGALDPTASTDGGGDAATIVVYVASSVSSLFSLLANVVVTGLVVPVVTRAAIGEKLTAGEAWRQVRRRLPALVGLAFLELLLLVLLVGVATAAGAGAGYALGGVVPAVILGVLLFGISVLAVICIHMKWFQLAAPALIVEKRGVFASIARAGRLSGGSFWRILGITLLASLLTGIVAQIIGVPFTVLGTVGGAVIPDPFGPIVLLVSSNLATVVSGAIVAPFTAAVAVLQYLDQRFRREGFDLDLITHVQRQQTP